MYWTELHVMLIHFNQNIMYRLLSSYFCYLKIKIVSSIFIFLQYIMINNFVFDVLFSFFCLVLILCTLTSNTAGDSVFSFCAFVSSSCTVSTASLEYVCNRNIKPTGNSLNGRLTKQNPQCCYNQLFPKV